VAATTPVRRIGADVSARATRLVIGGIIVLLALVLAAWWYARYERVEVEVPVPPRGEAAYNPLYALKKALVASGHEVVARANLNLAAMALGPRDTLVLGSDVRTLSADQVAALLAWVDGGGALLFGLPAGTRERPGALVDQLDLRLDDEAGQCLRLSATPAAAAAGRDGRQTLCFDTLVARAGIDEDEFDLLAGEPGRGYYLVGRDHGDGQWTAAGTLRFLRNDALDKGANTDLAWQVLAPLLHGGRVHLVYASDVPPLYVLLLRYGWPLLLPAACALLAWLWLRARRFGPLLPPATTTRRALREHVEAAGEFVFRERKASALYAPLRRAFDARLRRDAPQLAALDGEDLVAAVAARTGQPPQQVRAALQPTDLNHPERFLAAVQWLARWGLR